MRSRRNFPDTDDDMDDDDRFQASRGFILYLDEDDNRYDKSPYIILLRRKFYDTVHNAVNIYLAKNPSQPKVFGVKFSLRYIERIFSVEIRNFKLWKMPN